MKQCCKKKLIFPALHKAMESSTTHSVGCLSDNVQQSGKGIIIDTCQLLNMIPLQNLHHNFICCKFNISVVAKKKKKIFIRIGQGDGFLLILKHINGQKNACLLVCISKFKVNRSILRNRERARIIATKILIV